MCVCFSHANLTKTLYWCSLPYYYNISLFGLSGSSLCTGEGGERAGEGRVGQASRAYIIAESAQRSRYIFPFTHFGSWHSASVDFEYLSEFSSCN